MFDQLTKYLVRYKRVSLPSVGTIYLVQTPAQLNVADKLLMPPQVAAELRDEDTVPAHQLAWLSAVLREQEETVRQSLQELGAAVREKMAAGGFEWTGIGRLKKGSIDSAVAARGFEPVAAERILRRDAEHNVLVGDQQMTSTQMAERRDDGVVVKQKTSILVIIGWIVLLLSVLYIIFVLYQGRFRVDATGSRQAPTGSFLIHSTRAV